MKRSATAGLLALALLAPGCANEVVAWEFELDSTILDRSARSLDAHVLRGGCEGQREASYHFERGGMAPLPDALEPGLWGFTIEARDAECMIIGAGCEERELPAAASEGVFVRVTPLTEPRRGDLPCECDTGVCTNLLP